MKRTALFIDGPNLWATAKTLKLDLDFKRLREHFIDGLVRAYYYTAVHENAQEEYSSIKPLTDWLVYNGFTLVSKPVKTFTDELTGLTKVKGNMDIEIAVDALDLSAHIDHAIFFTGDGDFKSLLLSLQRRGVQCTVVSTIRTNPPMCADELRRTADTFIDLDDLQQYVGKSGVRVSRYGGNRAP